MFVYQYQIKVTGTKKTCLFILFASGLPSTECGSLVKKFTTVESVCKSGYYQMSLLALPIHLRFYALYKCTLD